MVESLFISALPQTFSLLLQYGFLWGQYISKNSQSSYAHTKYKPFQYILLCINIKYCLWFKDCVRCWWSYLCWERGLSLSRFFHLPVGALWSEKALPSAPVRTNAVSMLMHRAHHAPWVRFGLPEFGLSGTPRLGGRKYLRFFFMKNIVNKARRRCLLSHKTTVAPAYFDPEFFATQKGLLSSLSALSLMKHPKHFCRKESCLCVCRNMHTRGDFFLSLMVYH